VKSVIDWLYNALPCARRGTSKGGGKMRKTFETVLAYIGLDRGRRKSGACIGFPYKTFFGLVYRTYLNFDSINIHINHGIPVSI
jgi:hypothetical protein